VSEIVGFAGLSHSPFAALLPPAGEGEPGAAFLADADRVRRAAVRLDADAVVVIGPDHFHANFYDVLPPFVIGVEEAVGFGDFGGTPGPLPVASELAWAVHGHLADTGFDVALSLSLTVDHGIVQSYEMVTGRARLPIVPLVVNTAAPPLPGLARCVALGTALGDAIRKSDVPGRVLVVASGGLSHWLPSNDPRDAAMPAAKREALIHGRRDTRAFAAAREPGVRALGGDRSARVNAEWDRWFLRQLSTSDLSPVVELGTDGVAEAAGSGGQEVRTWLIGHAAARLPLRWTGYEPVPEWITGMASGASFPVP
jgi:2,3-dihydroxyphenylpropionate 1,2-dioxygenase